MYTFEVHTRRCYVVMPECANVARAWLLRGLFWTYRAFAERELVALGFHLVHCDLEGLLANERARMILDEAYALVTADTPRHDGDGVRTQVAQRIANPDPTELHQEMALIATLMGRLERLGKNQ